MRPSQRAGRAAVATVAAAVIGTGGVAVGAAAAGPGDTARPATAPASQPAGSGRVVSVSFARDGAERTVQLTLGELPGA